MIRVQYSTDREVLSACGAAARAGGEVRSAKVLGVCGPPLTPCWRGEVRSARRKGWTAAHAPLRRVVRSAAAHAARHALSTSRSVLHTDHLRTAPPYVQVVFGAGTTPGRLTVSCNRLCSSVLCGPQGLLGRMRVQTPRRASMEGLGSSGGLA